MIVLDTVYSYVSLHSSYEYYIMFTCIDYTVNNYYLRKADRRFTKVVHLFIYFHNLFDLKFKCSQKKLTM